VSGQGIVKITSWTEEFSKASKQLDNEKRICEVSAAYAKIPAVRLYKSSCQKNCNKIIGLAEEVLNDVPEVIEPYVDALAGLSSLKKHCPKAGWVNEFWCQRAKVLLVDNAAALGNLDDLGRAVCKKTIKLLEKMVWDEKPLGSNAWKWFVKGLIPLVEFPLFPEVYFKRADKLQNGFGSWRVFKAITARNRGRKWLSLPAIRSAFSVLFSNDKQMLRVFGKQLALQVRRFQGQQILTEHVNRVSDLDIRGRLLGSLVCFLQGQENQGRAHRVPFLLDNAELFVKDSPTADQIELKKLVFGDAVTRILRHAEWRVKFMLKLLVAMRGDGWEYKSEATRLQCGRAEKGLKQCHSAIISSVSCKKDDKLLSCAAGGGFRSLKFFHEINHTVNLEELCNTVDGYVESRHGFDGEEEGEIIEGVRNLMNPILNQVSGFDVENQLSPRQACAQFVDLLVTAHEYVAKHSSCVAAEAKEVEGSGSDSDNDNNADGDDLKIIEYAKLHNWVYEKIAPKNADGNRILSGDFLKRCAQEDLGENVDLDDLNALFARWQKKLLDE